MVPGDGLKLLSDRKANKLELEANRKVECALKKKPEHAVLRFFKTSTGFKRTRVVSVTSFSLQSS